jgi:hypothetical protein
LGHLRGCRRDSDSNRDIHAAQLGAAGMAVIDRTDVGYRVVCDGCLASSQEFNDQGLTITAMKIELINHGWRTYIDRAGRYHDSCPSCIEKEKDQGAGNEQ